MLQLFNDSPTSMRSSDTYRKCSHNTMLPITKCTYHTKNDNQPALAAAAGSSNSSGNLHLHLYHTFDVLPRCPDRFAYITNNSGRKCKPQFGRGARHPFHRCHGGTIEDDPVCRSSLPWTFAVGSRVSENQGVRILGPKR